MADIKLVLTDMDGTVVQMLSHQVSDKVRAAVIAAEDKGVMVVPVTGRPFSMAQNVMNILGFKDYCVVDNGASIRHAVTGKLIWSQWIDVELTRKIVAAILPFCDIIGYTSNGDEHAPGEDELAQVREPAPYVVGIIKTEDTAKVEAALTPIPGIAYHIIARPAEPDITAVQINHEAATKFHGVEELRKLVGIPKSQTLGIGDGFNDLPLFENAGLKIAMGNAADELKVAADYVVATVEQDGFAEAINRFVLS